MDARQVILKPVISEKSYQMSEENKYTFHVHPDAGKPKIRAAVEEIFDVSVIGVNTVTVKPKPKRRGMHQGRTKTVSYTHLRAHETDSYLVCRLLLEKKKKNREK